jgi:hypothetical protein
MVAMTRPRSLQITAQADAPELGPEQKRFNKLNQQLEQAKQKLAAWQRNIPSFFGAHRERTAPLTEALLNTHREWVLALDRLLDDTRWTKSERATLRETLCDGAWHLLNDAEAPDPDVQAVYDKHADDPFAAAKADERQALLDMIKEEIGLDLGDEAAHWSEDELLANVHQKMRERAAQQADHQAAHQQAHEQAHGHAGATPPPPRKPTKAQARQQAEAELSAQSLRDIYRKLASALHPDREPDAEKREARTALMQRVNQAYDRKDLLALLQLQLETAQICANDLATTAPARLKLYNKALAEQLAEIKEELHRVEMGFKMDFNVPPDVTVRPDKLVAVLEAIVGDLRQSQLTFERDLRAFKDPASTKRWIKAERERARMESMMGGWGF